MSLHGPKVSGTGQSVLVPSATALAHHLARQAAENSQAAQMGVSMRLARVVQHAGQQIGESMGLTKVVQHAGQQIAGQAHDTQEIPESVTAELEKLEQEGGPMVEVEGVSAILADLGDDDELLDENLDLEEEENKEEHKGVKREQPGKGSGPDKPPEPAQPSEPTTPQIKEEPTTIVTTPTTPSGVPSDSDTPTTPTVVSAVSQQSAVLAQEQQAVHTSSQELTQQVQSVHQSLQQHLVQTSVAPLTQQAVLSRQLTSRMVSQDGVTVSFQSTFPQGAPGTVVHTVSPQLQRLTQGHIQVSQQQQQQQQQRVAMRLTSREGQTRVVSVGPGGQIIQHSGVGVSMGAPPPPPYPGPPPPYPGPAQIAGPPGMRAVGMGLPLGPPRPPPMGLVPQQQLVHGGMMGGIIPGNVPPQVQRRPLLLQATNFNNLPRPLQIALRYIQLFYFLLERVLGLTFGLEDKLLF
ncbi:unnamed protein product [Timema podura]|uniref:Uncharacterized protein n=1 Tax=Timema podura TaxID=61482 RepID=A0ABN7NEW0_TIMPD|nr:unnamed protein product [Timema podura]